VTLPLSYSRVEFLFINFLMVKPAFLRNLHRLMPLRLVVLLVILLTLIVILTLIFISISLLRLVGRHLPDLQHSTPRTLGRPSLGRLEAGFG